MMTRSQRDLQRHGDAKYFGQTVTSQAKRKFADEAELVLFSPTKCSSCPGTCVCVCVFEHFCTEVFSTLHSQVSHH